MSELEIVIIALLIIIIAWSAFLSWNLWRTKKHYHDLTAGINKKDLQTILDKILKDLDSDKEQSKILKKEIDKINIENLGNLQKIGFVRFNPFPETGGNQSFCVAILDGNNNGMVLSSLHSRDATRVYAKLIKSGKAKDYDLSLEEKQAITKAVV